MRGRPDSTLGTSHEFAPSYAAPQPPPIFQIGDGHLILDSTDLSLSDRFRRLYGDCAVAPGEARGPRVECSVSSARDGGVVIEITDAESVHVDEFLEKVFADRECRRVSTDLDGWHVMQSRQPDVTFRVRDRRLTFAAGSHWRALVANLAMGLLIRLQHDVIFMHASSVAIGGEHGLLFVGPKGAGKTTTALGLASRGHGFLGDELVGVRQETLDLVPVRRTISKRDGPCASAVDRSLSSVATWPARYPSGETRTIVPASALFTEHHAATRLRHIVFLAGFGETPALTPISPSLEAASRLTPVTSTLWGRTPTARAFDLVKLLGRATSHTLTLGPPDRTAALLEERFSQ